MAALDFHKSNSKSNSNNNNIGSTSMESNTNKTKASVHYQLFIHKAELRRREPAQISIAKSKINLTKSLISENMQTVTDCSMETLKIIHREMSFQKQLQAELSLYAKFIKMGMSFRRGVKNGRTITSASK